MLIEARMSTIVRHRSDNDREGLWSPARPQAFAIIGIHLARQPDETVRINRVRRRSIVPNLGVVRGRKSNLGAPPMTRLYATCAASLREWRLPVRWHR